MNILSKAGIFLKKNNSVISSLSSITLGVMAIIVSVKSCQVAEYQSSLSEIAYQPHIKVESTLLPDSVSGTFKQEIITVSNEGDYVRDVNVEYKTFLVSEMSLTQGDQPSKIIFPVVGYFDFRVHTNNSSGVLYFIMPDGSSDNNSKMAALISGTSNLETKDGNLYQHLELLTFVSVTFIDKLGRQQAQHFRMSSYDGRKVSKDEIEEVNAESAMAPTLDFDKVEIGTLSTLITKTHFSGQCNNLRM